MLYFYYIFIFELITPLLQKYAQISNFSPTLSSKFELNYFILINFYEPKFKNLNSAADIKQINVFLINFFPKKA